MVWNIAPSYDLPENESHLSSKHCVIKLWILTMEALDIIVATVKEASYLAVNHPLLSVLGLFVLVLGLFRFYCRLTLGVCDCLQDMRGKTVLITGSSAGIGKFAALDLARRNARVIMACRNISKAQGVADEIRRATGNQNVVVKELDLTSFESVRRCAASILKTEKKLHVLINNAGISGRKIREVTEDGNELVMQSNHLGHFLLTLLLLDVLKRSSPSRIINVSSSAHSMSKLDPRDINSEKKYSSLTNYANTKTANLLFTKELAKRLAGSGITVNALHPGIVKTDILKGSDGYFIPLTKLLFILIGKTSEEGAQTTIHLAVSPMLEHVSGKYFSDCKEDTLSAAAKDSASAKILFESSEKITGISFK